MISMINTLIIFFIKLLPKSLVRIFAKQYVAGETIHDVLSVVHKLNNNGIKATVDILGEHITDKKQINKIIFEYKELYKQIKEKNLDSNISIKPTHIGLDISYDYTLNNFNDILKTATQHQNFLRIDMESSKVTDNTISLYEDLIDEKCGLGPVFQAYLHRTYDDIKNIKNQAQLNFRLCKGIY